mmetsp:Transcript_22508/g.72429  ORF Transcript_22508/g.72429 Transcript_22508/m.72429 type:complete len:264 (+) Transcript_22508:28-819(+)
MASSYVVFSAECWPVFLEGLGELPLRWLGRISYYVPCATQAVSKVVGYGIILGSFGYKVPQIVAVISRKSADGLSVAAMELDVLVFLTSLGYSLRQELPFSAFGEQAVVLAQNVVLLILAKHFSGGGGGVDARLLGGLVVFVLACVAIATIPVVAVLPLVSVAASVASRVPQIYQNQTHRTTGVLSSATVLLNVLGALARVFTTLNEAKYDPIMLASYTTSFLLSAILLLQLLAFRHNNSDAHHPATTTTTATATKKTDKKSD